jgi:hypothetical protein
MEHAQLQHATRMPQHAQAKALCFHALRVINEVRLARRVFSALQIGTLILRVCVSVVKRENIKIRLVS